MVSRAEVRNFLAHYSSPYYDPVKAHEYYERNKKLKGERDAVALTSKEQRDTFAVSRDSVAKAKTKAITSRQEAEKVKREQLHAAAKASAEAISRALEELAASLRTGVQEVKLNTIPSNATPQQKAFLERENAKLRAAAAGKANKTYAGAAQQASIRRQRVSEDLSAALTEARESYQKAMKDLQAKYASDLSTEKRNIHDQIAGAPAPKKKQKR